MKLNNIIFLFVSIFIVIACSEKKESNHAKIIWDKFANGNNKTVHQYFTPIADISEDYYYQEFYENGNLKIQGLENQGIRKREWKVFFDNGNLNAKLTFDNDILNGPIELYNVNGAKIATDVAKNGQIYNDEINNFIMKNFDISENKPNRNDSLDIMVDSLKIILEEK